MSVPPARPMRLGLFLQGAGHHVAGWRHPEAEFGGENLGLIQRIAATAEAGHFDLLFLADGLTTSADAHPSFVARLEPVALLSALAMSTRSARPRRVACGAGSSMRMPASAASIASCVAAPAAQPAQLRKVRWASCSTASLQPREGWVATKRASACVIGGAWWSAATWVLRAILWSSSAIRVKRTGSGFHSRGASPGMCPEETSGIQIDLAFPCDACPACDVGFDEIGEDHG